MSTDFDILSGLALTMYGCGLMGIGSKKPRFAPKSKEKGDMFILFGLTWTLASPLLSSIYYAHRPCALFGGLLALGGAYIIGAREHASEAEV
jgi:hypothetical protein